MGDFDIVVIYTADVETAPNSLNLGAIKLNFEQVFLSKFNGQKMYDDLKWKVDNNENLSSEDIMNFIIIPLTRKNDKQKYVEETIELAKKIKDEEKQSFIIAGIISASDKFIDNDYSNKVKEWIRMTKVARLFEQEKIDAVKEALAKQAQEKELEKIDAINKATMEAEEKSKKVIAQNLLSMNIDILGIMKATGLQKSEILQLKENQ